LITQRRLGSDSGMREILVSHPTIYEEIPVVGRPGIRLPYVKYFGLHYQIFEDKVVVTVMPGLDWQVPNTEFIQALKSNLDRIMSLFEKDNS